MAHPGATTYPGATTFPGGTSYSLIPIATNSDFFKINTDGEWSLVRGAARILIAPLDTEFPTEINDIIQLGSSIETPPFSYPSPYLYPELKLYPYDNIIITDQKYDAKNGWQDLGATKDGIQISISHSLGPIQINRTTLQTERVPDKWRCSIKTNLAEVTLEHMQFAWHGSSITQSIPTGGSIFDERKMGYGTFHKKIKRRLAVLFKDNKYNLIRAFVFRGVVISPQQSGFSYNKTGSQSTISITLDAKPEKSLPKLSDRFFTVYEQTLS